jgi:translation initiation factor 2B subunit (eIF-2B alpha/beta/delta family)
MSEHLEHIAKLLEKAEKHMVSIPELLKQLNASVVQLSTDIKASAAGAATPEHIQPVIDQLTAISPKIDSVVAATVDTTPDAQPAS